MPVDAALNLNSRVTLSPANRAIAFRAGPNAAATLSAARRAKLIRRHCEAIHG
jgi:hypothetical protein